MCVYIYLYLCIRTHTQKKDPQLRNSNKDPEP